MTPAAAHAARLLADAVPVTREDTATAWDSIDVLARVDAGARLFWDSRVPGSGAPECLMAAAFQSLENKGFRLPRYEDELRAGLGALAVDDMERLQRASFRLRAIMRAAEPDPGHKSRHTTRYPDWSAFDAATTWPADIAVDVHAHAFARAIDGGWRAQLVGAAAGTALEGYTAEAIARAFGPVRDYVRPPDTYNDDITYELAFLDAFARRGTTLASADIAEEWVALIPSGWSAEQVALDNLRRGVMPPESGTRDNPFDEWIGAQMRGAICGMLAPGRVRKAARLAWLDGQISHAGNGILGEVFNAALIARAFVSRDARALLDETVALFGTETEYGAAIRFARDACRAPGWRDAWAGCATRYADHNWIHVLPNAAAQVVALWYGDGDFDATLEVACGIGHDADCNAAQVLTAIGIMRGADAIHPRWTLPLGDHVLTTMRRPTSIPIAELVAHTVATARRWA